MESFGSPNWENDDPRPALNRAMEELTQAAPLQQLEGYVVGRGTFFPYDTELPGTPFLTLGWVDEAGNAHKWSLRPQQALDIIGDLQLMLERIAHAAEIDDARLKALIEEDPDATV